MNISSSLKNEEFRKAILATGTSSFTHSKGKNKIVETVLIPREFCNQLYRIRDKIKRETV